MGGVDFLNKPEEGFAQWEREVALREKGNKPLISTGARVS